MSLVLGMSASSCSVDMFSKHSKDGAVSGRETYRKISPECSGIQIERTEMDPATFRSLMNCLNANGSIPEIHSLIAGASEARLGQSVSILNDAFLSDPEVLKQSRAIIRTLEREGKWQPIMAGFRGALEDPNRLRALIRLLSVGDSTSENQTLVEGTLSKTVSRLDARETMAAFELFQRLLGSKSFRSFQSKVMSDPLTLAERTRFVAILSDFFKRSTRYRSAHWLFSDMVAGKSAPLWQFAFGEGETILSRTSEFHTLLKDFGARGGQGLKSFSLFHLGFHRPVTCWGGGKVFPAPWKNLTSEFMAHSGRSQMLPFILRFTPVTALNVRDLCAIPNEFFDHYGEVAQFALGRSGGAYIDVLDRVFQSGLGESAGYFVGEWGGSLSEILSMIESKSWFGDLMLLFAELDPGDRDRIASWMKVLLAEEGHWSALSQSWTEPGIRSVFSDLGDVLSADPESLGSMLNSIGSLFEVSASHPWFQAWKRIALKSSHGEEGLGALVTSDEFPNAAKALGKMAADGRLANLLSSMLEWLGGDESGVVAEMSREPSLKKSLRHNFSGSSLLSGETRLRLDASLFACAKLDVRLSASAQWKNYQDCVSGGGIEASSFGALKARGPFLDSFLQSWITLPLPLSEKKGVVAQIVGAKEWFSSLFKSNEESRSMAGLFQNIGRLQSSLSLKRENWDGFFSVLSSAISDERLPGFYEALRGLERPRPAAREALGPAPSPDLSSLALFVKQVECENPLSPSESLARAGEVSAEFSNAVQGWETRNGALRTQWSTQDLSPRLNTLLGTLQSAPLRSNLYRWLGGMSGGKTAQWFFQRAREPRAVTVMDAQTGKLRVRWMTSLDRLESILVNSNFTYLLSGNYGLKFIGKFAEAWGDEPRNRWPKEIQERYSGSARPPTLREVYGEVSAFLGYFASVGGLPKLPACAAGVVSGPSAAAPDFLISSELKAKAFNLKQTLSVIEENLPGSGSPNAGGMLFLRNLFWAVHSSGRHSLELFQALGDVGGLRLLSKGFQSIETQSEVTAIADAVESLGAAVKTPEFDSLAKKFVESPTLVSRFTKATEQKDFHLARLVERLTTGLAIDRTTRIAPSLIRFFHAVTREGKLPESLIADFLAQLGKGETNEKIFTLRTVDKNSERALRDFPAFFEDRVLRAFHSLSLPGMLNLLDRDPLLRKDLLREFDLWTVSRQTPGTDSTRNENASGAFWGSADLILSREKPALRRALALWCGRSAGSLVNDLMSRPDEAGLMIDGLLQASNSPVFEDFLEALLRQLPD